MTFKEWYVARNGAYPGVAGEDYSVIFMRLCNGFADYVDEALKAQAEAPTPVFKPSAAESKSAE